MRTTPLTRLAALPLLLLAGCASLPNGPSVMALPGTGKSFEQFRRDDADCRQYAQFQIGGSTAEQNSVDAGLRSAAVGTVVGAVAGAAIGGRDGAGVGAGTGLLMGSMVGSSEAHRSGYGTQRNYDNAYVQCMYAKGQKVPVAGTVANSFIQTPTEHASPAVNTALPAGIPAPPPGLPPPPPQKNLPR